MEEPYFFCEAIENKENLWKSLAFGGGRAKVWMKSRSTIRQMVSI